MTRLHEIKTRIARRKAATEIMYVQNLIRDPYSVVDTPEYKEADRERWAASSDYFDHHQDDLEDLLAFAQKVREIYDGPDPAEEAMDLIGNELHKLENP